MASRQIIFICAPDSKAIRAVRKSVGGRDFHWVYLGNTFDQPPDVTSWLTEAGKIQISDWLKKASGDLRQAYIDYIGGLGQLYYSSKWWKSCLAEKNPYFSRAFFNACCIRACKDLIASKQGAVPFVLIVENPSLRKALLTNLSGDDADLDLYQDKFLRVKLLLSDILEMLIRKGYYLFLNLKRVFYARYVFRLHRSQPISDAVRSKKSICVVHAWVDQRAYNPVSGGFQDQDFSGVARYFENKGKLVFTLPNILSAVSYRRVVRYIARASENYLVPDAFLRPIDIFRAAILSSAIPKRENYPLFANMEISELLYHDIWKDWILNRAAGDFLVEQWIKRWKEAGLSIERFIYTFENHRWERVICETLRKFYPAARLIAHQPNGVPLFLMNYFISDSERNLMPLPDLIVTNGAYAAGLLQNSGYGPDLIKCGGGLRQRYLEDLIKEDGKASKIRKAPWRILVTPSVSSESTLELVWKSIHAFERESDLSVIIKLHPSVPLKRIEAALKSKKVPDHLKITNEPVRDLLRDADVLIYNDGTFPCAEALAVGVPVVYVEPDYGLALDSLDSYPALRLRARCPEEIAVCVRQLLSEGTCVPEARSRFHEAARQLIGRVDEKTYELFGL